MALYPSMVGRKIQSVELSDGRTQLTFEFVGGSRKTFTTEGDCCSHSWVEHLEMPDDVIGAVILDVSESAPVGYEPGARASSKAVLARQVEEAMDAEDDKYGNECIQVYNTYFTTDRGVIVLEYRNSSNGYYGGYLVERDYEYG